MGRQFCHEAIRPQVINMSTCVRICLFAHISCMMVLACLSANVYISLLSNFVFQDFAVGHHHLVFVDIL